MVHSSVGKTYRLSSLNNTHLFSVDLEIWVLEGLVSPEAPFLSTQVTIF